MWAWTDLVQDREKWRALVKAVVNLDVLQNTGNFLIIGGKYYLLKDFG